MISPIMQSHAGQTPISSEPLQSFAKVATRSRVPFRANVCALITLMLVRWDTSSHPATVGPCFDSPSPLKKLLCLLIA